MPPRWAAMAKTRTLKARLRRKRWERVGDGLFFAALPFLMVLALLTMPIWMPLVAWGMKRDEKRMLAAAQATACARCGRALGAEALARAEAEEAERHAAECEADKLEQTDWMMSETPGRYVRILRAMCVGCGAFYAYDSGPRAFRLLPDDRRL